MNEDSPTAFPCAHHWIDPNDPPIQRVSYSPIMGRLRRQMKPNTVYRCRRCGVEIRTPDITLRD